MRECKKMKEKKVFSIEVEKIKNIVIIVLILIIIIGGSFVVTELGTKEQKDSEDTVEMDSSSTKAQEESASISEEEQKELESIDIDRYLEIKEQEEPSVIYIARPTCEFCRIQDPIIKNIAYQYDATFYYLNTDEMSAEDSISFTNSSEKFKDGFGTPCTIVVEDDEVVAKAEGVIEREELVEFLKKNGIELNK